MIKSKLVQSTYGKVRVIESSRDKVRYYVSKTSEKTWVVSCFPFLTLESMVEVDGEFHFGTLKDLHEAFNRSHLSV